jgi:hypothetical protein
MALAAGSIMQPKLWLALVALTGIRLVHFWRLASDLRIGERLAALPLGIVSDVIYCAAFHTGAALWVLRGKSRLSSSQHAGGAIAPRM